MEVINPTRKVKARKDHFCDFCGILITKGESYNVSVLKIDFIYQWKSHIRCYEIASELNMYDECDSYGLDSDSFCESIQCEYQNIWRKKDLEYYESDDFIYPDFKDQLDFVCNHHLNKEE